MPKKAQKVAKGSDLRQDQSRQQEASTPFLGWGKVSPPPAPTIPPAGRRESTAARHRPAFISDTGRPSRLLAELMSSPTTVPPPNGSPILEAGALACRRQKKGELLILLVSKRRSAKWGIPKGRLDGRLTFGEVAAKEAFEEAGIKGFVSPNSIGMFRMKKRTPNRQHCQVVEVWVYLIEVTKRLRDWPEKGKREIRWVSCETAAQQLREPMLAEICLRLANG
jgi:8-oxo-dGTP pyrophosphatase MutT (NUDIX family)